MLSYSVICQRKIFIVAGNHEYKETDSVNSVQSSEVSFFG